MVLGVLLPHTKLYGGVKRFLELGNIFIQQGHQFYVFVNSGGAPDWMDFKGDVVGFSEIAQVKLDVLFFTEPRYLDEILKADAVRKVFYFVRGNENLRVFKKHPQIEFFANSINMYELAKKKFNIDAFKAFGGIRLDLYSSKEILPYDNSRPFVVMAYGRLAEGRKGTKYVVRACERLYRKGYNIKLLLFDTPVDAKMQRLIDEFSCKVPHEFVLNFPVAKNNELFHKADVFVAPEKKAGWANTVVEAMASGIPVIATESGTNDFLFHLKSGYVIRRNSYSVSKGIKILMSDDILRKELAENGRKTIEAFDWSVLAGKILRHFQS